MALFNGFLIVFFIVLFAALIFVGQTLRTSQFLRRKLPLAFCFFMGVIIIFQFFIPPENPLYKEIEDLSTKWIQIISSFALVIGLISLVTMNFNKISRKYEDWQYAVVLLLGFFVTTFYGLRDGFEGKEFDFIFNYMYVPMQSTMFSILAFFVASAAFRAFRARSREATLLLTAAVIVMLGRVELGSVLWSYIPFIGNYFDVSDLAQWINKVFTTAGQRAILLGASLGYIAASFKILLGIERSYFGSEE
jgi:hypothetical protein